MIIPRYAELVAQNSPAMRFGMSARKMLQNMNSTRIIIEKFAKAVMNPLTGTDILHSAIILAFAMNAALQKFNSQLIPTKSAVMTLPVTGMNVKNAVKSYM